MNETKTIDVLDVKGKKAGSAELPGDLFDVNTNIPLIHQVVVAQLAAARQGTHATKTRGQVSGGGKKPWRQKGTGRARQGSTRAPQWVGGGTVHGPQPRSYAQRTPKKMVAAALRGALSDMARDNRIFVVTSLVDGDKPSTKQAKAVLSGVAELRKVLVVLDRSDEIDWLATKSTGYRCVTSPRFTFWLPISSTPMTSSTPGPSCSARLASTLSLVPAALIPRP